MNWMRANSSPSTARERPRDERLAQAGQVLEQDVAAGQDADQHELQGPAAADHRALQLVQDGRARPRRLDGAHHSLSNRSMRRARVRLGMPGSVPAFDAGVCGLAGRVDPRPQVGVAGTAAEQPPGRVRVLVEVHAVAFGQPGGQQVLEHRPELALVEAPAGDRAVHHEAPVRVAAQQPGLRLLPGLPGRVRGQRGQQVAQHDHRGRRPGGDRHGQPRPAGQEVARRGRHHDHHARDHELGPRPAPGADRGPGLRGISGRAHLAAPSASSARARSAASSSRACSAASRCRWPSGWLENLAS